MELGLSGKVVLIGGSSRGIGKAIALRFLEEGSLVSITGRGAAHLTETETELETKFGSNAVRGFQGDLADINSAKAIIGQVVSTFGDLDVLVCNAGSGRVRSGVDTSVADFAEAFHKNLDPAANLISMVLPRMVERRRGSIVCIGSIAGVEEIGAPAAYGAAKAALTSYAGSLARAAGPSGVRVNCVAPGNVLFQGGTWERRLEANRTDVQSFIDREVPLRRFGRPEEIADSVAYLCSDRASFITGACLVVDGGQTRSM